MPNLGDIVHVTGEWCRILGRGAHYMEIDGIIVSRGYGAYSILWANHDGAAIGNAAQEDYFARSTPYMEVIHRVNTLEAAVIHERLKERTPITYEYCLGECPRLYRTMPTNCWQEGDLVRRTVGAWNDINAGDLCVQIATQRFRKVLEEEEDDRMGRHTLSNFAWVGRPGSTIPEGAEDTLPTDAQQHPDNWQTGDILILTRQQNTGLYDNPRLPNHLPMGELVVFERIRHGDARVSLLGGISCDAGFDVGALSFYYRPQPLMSTNQEALKKGDRVLLLPEASYAGQVGTFYAMVNGTTAHILLDKGSVSTKTAIAHLRKVTLEEEPAYPPLAAKTAGQEPSKWGLNIWLDIRGMSQEAIYAFEKELTRLGMPYYGSTEYGTRGGKRQDYDHNLTGICIANDQWYYHRRGQFPAGYLERDWNTVLTRVSARTSYPLIEEKHKKTVAPKPEPLNTALKFLPLHFVVERDTKRPDKSATEQDAFLKKHGFRGSMGFYTLFSGNEALGTKLKGVADAFIKKHACVLLQANRDASIITSLFTKRASMITNSSASQRFAIDVAASGSHLITAFIAMMGAIGYRQENLDKKDGPYLLLNGGGLFADQAASWQYADTYYKRGKLFDLASEAVTAEGTTTPSGWQQVESRLVDQGVALPILDADNLARELKPGDEVVLVHNDVHPDLPETEETLRSHSCGLAYKVKMQLGDTYVLNTGLALHGSRLQLLETPLGIQNGDQVLMKSDYAGLTVGQKLTYQQKLLLDKDQNAFAVPAEFYGPLTDEALVTQLLERLRITLPFQAHITDSKLQTHDQELTMVDAWALNSQELVFFTEKGSDHTAFYPRDSFTIIQEVKEKDKPKYRTHRGATAADSFILVDKVKVSLAELEAAFA